MSAMIKRPPQPSATGMLCKEHSHSAWVTNDLDRALEIFEKRYGVGKFTFLEGEGPAGGKIKVAFAWAGGQVLEIIMASGPGFEFYNEMLPEEEFAIRFHHLGFIIDSDTDWKQLEQELQDGEWRIAHRVVVVDTDRVDPVNERWVPQEQLRSRRDRTDPSYAD